MSKVREFRKRLGLTISQLSHEVRVNASVLSWVELGKLSASPAVRKELANFYKEPEETLFNETGIAN